jgi:hypothetical protein
MYLPVAKFAAGDFGKAPQTAVRGSKLHLDEQDGVSLNKRKRGFAGLFERKTGVLRLF